MTTVKSITTRTFTIALEEAANGKYYVGYSIQGKQPPTISDGVQDLRLALMMFDSKVLELEGH